MLKYFGGNKIKSNPVCMRSAPNTIRVILAPQPDFRVKTNSRAVQLGRGDKPQGVDLKCVQAPKRRSAPGCGAPKHCHLRLMRMKAARHAAAVCDHRGRRLSKQSAAQYEALKKHSKSQLDVAHVDVEIV